jgi:hypothetical protein
MAGAASARVFAIELAFIRLLLATFGGDAMFGDRRTKRYLERGFIAGVCMIEAATILLGGLVTMFARPIL